ncbi:hypothetical protein N1027_00195 [Herbiconiux sp. CPCC 205763]|uniref:Major facilitator superfamily (MFS) profile domain-containing protein n=1 Tax=Herbiconiux aconitum TaxID=2970913 RepID=A0ABT2GK06_9MICO|nr:hypothetical protein [Herbiconiux aconitum]MCS5716553.1 hypothetical protein [Herbiconiux aconitum]
MISDTLTRRVLVGILLFGAISSFGGAVVAIFFGGGGVPADYLEGSAFTSFLMPGLVLGVIVGGTQLAGAVTLLLRPRAGIVVTAIAGFGMIIWIFVEIAVIREYSWLQTAYFAVGIAELVLVLALLGITPSIVRPAKGLRTTTESR